MLKIKNITNKAFFEEVLFALIENCMDIAVQKDYKDVEYKEDGTIITSADKEIHEIINNKLSELNFNIPIISEEGSFVKNDFLKPIYWLIDPIDGTSSYAKNKSEYSVNIALIANGKPVLGIIAHPPSKKVWFGYKDIAMLKQNDIIKNIAVKYEPKNKIRIVLSKNYDGVTKKLVNEISYDQPEYISSSLKFCMLAEGDIDIYPRLKSISKWDIAAGDAILRAAGGFILNADGKEFDYKTSEIKTGIFFALSSKKIWNKIVKPKFINL